MQQFLYSMWLAVLPHLLLLRAGILTGTTSVILLHTHRASLTWATELLSSRYSNTQSLTWFYITDLHVWAIISHLPIVSLQLENPHAVGKTITSFHKSISFPVCPPLLLSSCVAVSPEVSGVSMTVVYHVDYMCWDTMFVCLQLTGSNRSASGVCMYCACMFMCVYVSVWCVCVWWLFGVYAVARKINIGKFVHRKTSVLIVTDVAVSIPLNYC